MDAPEPSAAKLWRVVWWLPVLGVAILLAGCESEGEVDPYRSHFDLTIVNATRATVQVEYVREYQWYTFVPLQSHYSTQWRDIGPKEAVSLDACSEAFDTTTCSITLHYRDAHTSEHFSGGKDHKFTIRPGYLGLPGDG